MRRLLLVGLLLPAAFAATRDIEAVFAPLADAKSPGLAVLVVRDGHVVFERGYNARDLRTLAPIDAHTNFRLASFTKQFTATAVMMLVRDGKLRYDERLTDVFPDLPAYGQAITIRHLLTHTSGLPDYEELMEGGSWTAEHQIQDDEVLALLKRQSTGKFAPGTSWSYSNSGYVVLGLLVAKASGESYADYLREHIFMPLQMNDSVVHLKGKNSISSRAFGYTKDGERFVETDQSSTSATLGDGGIYSNLEDLAKWDAAIEHHTLLSEAEMRPALTPVQFTDVDYGFGWFLDPFEGHARMWHSGSTMGFRTVIERFTADKVTVVILCNRTDLEPDKLALKVYQALSQ